MEGGLRLSWLGLAGALLAGWLILVAFIGAIVLAASPPGGCGGLADHAPDPSSPTPGPERTPAAAPTPAPSASGRDEIPASLLPIFARAAAVYRLGPQGWAWLAAINRQETDFGRNLSVSSAGAMGWMQFLPATWARYAVDARGTGHPDPYNPTDAIFTAARYLRASGAPRSWPRAVLTYNHADWYLRQVADHARAYLGGAFLTVGQSPVGTGYGSDAAVGSGCAGAPAVGGPLDAQGYALPLAANYMRPLGRTDDGVDIETAPDGATVYSITPGRCSAVASDPRGFGPSYPVIQAGTGSLAGQFIYYGHVARSLVRAGQPVAAGQPIAVIGHTGDAAGLGHGHIEIGFSSASGDPLSHHGARSWTPNGARMRTFLIGLDAAFGIRAG